MDFSSFLELLRNLGLVATKGPGPVVVIVLALILAGGQIISARGGRLRIRDPESLRKAIERLELWLHILLNPKVRAQIVDYESGALLIRLPDSIEGLFKLAGYLADRHGDNVGAFGHIRPYLTRYEKGRLARLKRRVDGKRHRFGVLMDSAQKHHEGGREKQADKTFKNAILAVATYMDEAVGFEKQLVTSIQNSLNYYEERLLSS